MQYPVPIPLYCNAEDSVQTQYLAMYGAAATRFDLPLAAQLLTTAGQTTWGSLKASSHYTKHNLASNMQMHTKKLKFKKFPIMKKAFDVGSLIPWHSSL
jgi:hypothetical protein